MTLLYLWQHRRRHPFGSRAWLKSWAKRIYNAIPLFLICLRQNWLRIQRARIGQLTVVNANFDGPLTNLCIGEETSIGRARIVLHGSVTVGSRVTVNDNVAILTASHDLKDTRWATFCKPVQIDDYAWIAEGAMLLPGVHIGRGAVVGAGAIVRNDVKPYTVVIGNPAINAERVRVADLCYSPVAFLAPFEAWLERPTWAANHALRNRTLEIYKTSQSGTERS